MAQNGTREEKMQNKRIDSGHPEFELTIDMMLGIGMM